MNQYKTLREIDGQQYISLAEHEEIAGSIVDLQQAMQSIKEVMGTLNQATSALASTVGCK